MRKFCIALTLLAASSTVAFGADPAPLDGSTVQAEIAARVKLLVDGLAERDAKISALKNAPPATAPAPSQPPVAATTYRELPVDGKAVQIGGAPWAAQTPRVLQGSDGSYVFSAKAGERASFDPPRKIRSEVIGLAKYAKGEEIRIKGKFNIRADSVFTGADWCSFVQIHQADTKRADGIYVNASPVFAADLLPDPKTGKLFLQARGETGRGNQPTFSPMRVFGKLPDVALGVDHTFELLFVDGHGGPGRVSFWVDGNALVDQPDIPTGYEYVDIYKDAYLIKGKSQPTESYLKLGIYAGKFSGDAPPPAFNISFTLRDLTTK